ncbi:hypothetical protein D9M70_543760 [compost metagenome]
MAAQVHAHDVVPVRLGQADEHAVAADAGVVDQHVHLAEGRDRGIDDALRGSQLRDVVIAGQSAAAGGADFRADRLGRLAPDVVDDHVGALGAEGQRIGAAEPAAGAGDDDGASVANTHGALLTAVR